MARGGGKGSGEGAGKGGALVRCSLGVAPATATAAASFPIHSNRRTLGTEPREAAATETVTLRPAAGSADPPRPPHPAETRW